MSEMPNESDEQKTGKAHGQKKESGVQQDERPYVTQEKRKGPLKYSLPDDA